MMALNESGSQASDILTNTFSRPRPEDAAEVAAGLADALCAAVPDIAGPEVGAAGLWSQANKDPSAMENANTRNLILHTPRGRQANCRPGRMQVLAARTREFARELTYVRRSGFRRR